MRALVLGRPSARRIRVERLLDGAGDQAEVCHDGDWGCVGMDGGCPLDDRDIDVAIAVAEPGVRFDSQGVACVYRARIPIVTVGAGHNDPVVDYATADVARVDDDALATIRRAARDVSGHQEAVEEALDERLAGDERVRVAVRRGPSTIDVVLVGELPAARAAALTDVARAAVRSYDSRVSVINVSTSAA